MLRLLCAHIQDLSSSSLTTKQSYGEGWRRLVQTLFYPTSLHPFFFFFEFMIFSSIV